MAYPKIKIINSHEAIITATTAAGEYIRYLLIDNTPAAYIKYVDDQQVGLISTYYKPSPKAIKELLRVDTMAAAYKMEKVIFTTDPNQIIKHVKNYFTKL